MDDTRCIAVLPSETMLHPLGSVRCKVFNHHVMAALNHLDKGMHLSAPLLTLLHVAMVTKQTALNVSLATVGCDEFTELCTRLHVTTYPTVLLFTPSTLHSPQPLTGTLDSIHLLAALGQLSTDHDDASLVYKTVVFSLRNGLSCQFFFRVSSRRVLYQPC